MLRYCDFDRHVCKELGEPLWHRASDKNHNGSVNTVVDNVMGSVADIGSVVVNDDPDCDSVSDERPGHSIQFSDEPIMTYACKELCVVQS